jgi:hypothetical protein
MPIDASTQLVVLFGREMPGKPFTKRGISHRRKIKTTLDFSGVVLYAMSGQSNLLSV